MTCRICAQTKIWHGSDESHAMPGSYLSEMGCHDGIAMDDDVYHEGWDPQTYYPPCRFNPKRCLTCDGTGMAPPLMAEALKQDDCVDCQGTGWANGEVEWPIAATDLSDD